jgi:polysaccharide biosynthesis/export protein
LATGAIGPAVPAPAFLGGFSATLERQEARGIATGMEPAVLRRSRLDGQECRMDRTRLVQRRIGWIGCLAAAMFCCGCQTVRTPEETIAKSDIPREFAKTSLPTYVVEPPDFLMVEVLEALPGRPISGVRLVRPDGTITLGFYGDVYVAGLTLPEVKEKIVLHLRKYVNDEVLGLVAGDPNTQEQVPVSPRDSDRVFVDVDSYNSKHYYIYGDVSLPGRYPVTGNETVLDAISFAGGLLPTAAPQNIRLVRPAPPGSSCEQLLRVNYAAIINGGDPSTNYQIMPGDRLVVYRDPIVRTTVFLNRLAEPFSLVLNQMLSYSFMVRSLKSINIPINGVAPATSNRPSVTIGPGAQ